MNHIQKKSISVLPSYKQCSKCNKILSNPHEIQQDIEFYCDKCEIYTHWTNATKLHNSKLHYTQIEKLIAIFLDQKSATDALEILTYSFVNDYININTIRNYFILFCEIVLDYYDQQMSCMLLQGEVEIDESHLYKEKKSSAPHRHYKLSSIWLFGMKQRKSNKFFIIPLKNRKEDTLVPIIRKHIEVRSTIYTDSFSVYVNNWQKISKLAPYGFIHFFINHKLEFISQISEEIHTNTIESLWSQVKKTIKKTRVTSKYLLAIARYYFYKTLTPEQQIKFLIKGLSVIVH